MAKKTTKHTVLVIEDDPDIQNFIARVLELEGYHALKANDGEAGLQIIRDHYVSLVLLDLRLPVLHGWDVLREMKSDPELSAIPVVVITAAAEVSQRRRTMRLGASRYLVKPLSANSLSHAVAEILNKKVNLPGIAEKAAKYT